MYHPNYKPRTVAYGKGYSKINSRMDLIFIIYTFLLVFLNSFHLQFYSLCSNLPHLSLVNVLLNSHINALYIQSDVFHFTWKIVTVVTENESQQDPSVTFYVVVFFFWRVGEGAG